jgi:hypothetical protein
VIGFAGRDWLSAGIQLASLSLPFRGLSHVAIISTLPPPLGPLVLWESTSLATEPCIVAGKQVSGVQVHHPRRRILSHCGRVWHYRLAQPLSRDEIKQLAWFLHLHVGASYDYIGAFHSRRTPFGLIERMLCPENLHRIFCSELVAAALQTCGRHDRRLSRYNPTRLCRHLVKDGTLLRPRRLK